MLHILWSFAERMLPRVATAVVMVVLAMVLAPSSVGVFTLAVFFLTLLQSVSDTPMRQLGVRAVRSHAGRRFLRSYRRWAGPLGLVYMALALAATAEITNAGLGQILCLTPTLAVPVVVAMRIEQVAELESANRWRSLAAMQSLASVVGLTVCIPLLLVTRSLAAPALQYAIAEVAFMVLCFRQPTQPAEAIDNDQVGTPTIAQEFRYLAFYSGLSFGQSQAERLLIGLWSKAHTLGLYSFSQSLARNAGDAMSNGSATVLRTVLVGKNDLREIRSLAWAGTKRGLLLSAAAAVATIIGTRVAIAPLLGSAWDPALAAVPVMTLTIAPAMLAWCTTSILVTIGRLRDALPIKALGVLTTIPVALAARDSLQVAAWAGVAREVILLLLLWVPARRVFPRPAFAGLLVVSIVVAGSGILAEGWSAWLHG